jgi:hypothetical protein
MLRIIFGELFIMYQVDRDQHSMRMPLSDVFDASMNEDIPGWRDAAIEKARKYEDTDTWHELSDKRSASQNKKRMVNLRNDYCQPRSAGGGE